MLIFLEASLDIRFFSGPLPSEQDELVAYPFRLNQDINIYDQEFGHGGQCTIPVRNGTEMSIHSGAIFK